MSSTTFILRLNAANGCFMIVKALASFYRRVVRDSLQAWTYPFPQLANTCCRVSAESELCSSLAKVNHVLLKCSQAIVWLQLYNASEIRAAFFIASIFGKLPQWQFVLSSYVLTSYVQIASSTNNVMLSDKIQAIFCEANLNVCAQFLWVLRWCSSPPNSLPTGILSQCRQGSGTWAILEKPSPAVFLQDSKGALELKIRILMCLLLKGGVSIVKTDHKM